MRSIILLNLYLIACILFVGIVYHFPTTGIDDANIYFVYMKHFAHGQGFVYNIGGERVEGFTSLLWTLIGSFFFLFTSHIEICLFALNLLLMYGTLKLSTSIIKHFTKNNSIYIIAFLGLLITFPGFYDWNIYSLLETGLWTFELTCLSYLLVIPFLSEYISLRKSTFLILLFIPVVVISRPESILLIPTIIFIRAGQYYFRGNTIRHTYRDILLLILVFMASNYLLYRWRLYYFGFPFPNTYYIKMTDGFVTNIKEGLIYFSKYVIRVNPLITLMITSYFFWFFKNANKKYNIQEKNFILFPLLILSFLGLGIPLLTGGDHFRLSRFYQVFSPIFYITFLLILYDFRSEYKFTNILFQSKKSILLAICLCTILPLKNWYILFFNKKYTILTEFNIAKHNRELGIKLNQFFPDKKPSIAMIAAGGIAYTYEGKVNDVLGLNNLEVAHTFTDRPNNLLKSHRAFNKEIFLKQLPDLFLFEFVNDSTKFIPFTKRNNIDQQFGSKVIKHIYKDSNFNKEYTQVFLQSKKDDNLLFTFSKNKYLNSLDTSLFFIQPIN